MTAVGTEGKPVEPPTPKEPVKPEAPVAAAPDKFRRFRKK